MSRLGDSGAVRRALRGAAVAALLVAASLGAAAVAGAVGAPAAAASTVPQTTRRLNWPFSAHAPAMPTTPHASAREAPPYPLTDSTLADPHAWPNKALTSLGPCVLRVLSGDGDSIAEGESMEAAKPAHTLGLSYNCPPHVGPVIGPDYTWDPDGNLAIRSWGRYEGDGYVWREWSYYKTGELVGYLHQVWPKDMNGDPKALEEYFDREGKLLGYSVTPAIGDSATARWNGKPVSQAEFNKARSGAKTH